MPILFNLPENRLMYRYACPLSKSSNEPTHIKRDLGRVEAGIAWSAAPSGIERVLHNVTAITRALSGVLCIAVLLSLVFLIVELRSDAVLTISSANFAVKSIAPAVGNMTQSMKSMLSGADASLDSVKTIARASELVAMQSVPLLSKVINKTLIATDTLARVAMNPVLRLSLGDMQ